MKRNAVQWSAVLAEPFAQSPPRDGRRPYLEVMAELRQSRELVRDLQLKLAQARPERPASTAAAIAARLQAEGWSCRRIAERLGVTLAVARRLAALESHNVHNE